MAQEESPTSAWSWAGLWLWLGAFVLAGSAAYLALPWVAESSPGERAEAIRSSWLPVTMAALVGTAAAMAGTACLRRASR
jgi:hypothetical protein